jgi:dTDP-glucose pyrophosphorylase
MKNTININSRFDLCLTKLERLKHKILIVIDNNKKLVGTVTDGDLRRYIIKKKTNRKLFEMMNRKPKFVFEQKIYNYTKLKNKFLGINYLPILNRKKKYLGFINLKEDTELNNTSVIIMAGGKGVRLNPLTKNKPKPMIEINNKPLLFNIISTLKLQGFENFYVSVNYLYKKITIPLSKFAKENNIKVNFLKEKKFLGTAGPIKLVKKKFKNYLIINGDIITSLNFKDLISFHNEKKSDFTICTKSYENKIPFGVLKIFNNKVKNIIEKPTYHYDFCCGIYVFSKKIFNLLNLKKRLDMPDLIKKCTKKKLKIIPYMIHEYWNDIGSAETLIRLDNKYSKYFS